MSSHLLPEVFLSSDSPKTKFIYSGDGEFEATHTFTIRNAATSYDAYQYLFFGDGNGFPGVDGIDGPTILRTVEMEPVDGENSTWRARCFYQEPKKRTDENEKQPVGSYRIAFSTKGGTFTQTHGRTTTSYVASGSTAAPNYDGAIHVSDDGIAGVEVTIPTLVISVTKHQPGATLTPNYLKALAGITGGYNNSAFLGFDAGTLRFDGCDGTLSFDMPNPSPAGGPPMPAPSKEITYEFTYSPNITGLTIGGVSGIEKKGHQYLWTLPEKKIDNYSNALVQKVRAVYVHDIGVGAVSFGILNI